MSDSARRWIEDIIARDGEPGMQLMVSLVGGAANGVSWLMEIGHPPKDAVQIDGVPVVADLVTAMAHQQVEIDFVDDALGGGLKVVSVEYGDRTPIVPGVPDDADLLVV